MYDMKYMLCIDCLSVVSECKLSVIIYNTAQCIRKAYIRIEREIPLGNWYRWHVAIDDKMYDLCCIPIYTHISQYAYALRGNILRVNYVASVHIDSIR